MVRAAAYDAPQTAAKVSIATLAAWRTSRRTKPTGTGEQVVGQMIAEHEQKWCQHDQNPLRNRPPECNTKFCVREFAVTLFWGVSGAHGASE